MANNYGLNQVVLSGNLTKDPEILGGEKKCAKFILAVDSGRSPEFIVIKAFNGNVGPIGKFCKKGKKVVVEGSLRTNVWTDKHNNKHHDLEVIASKVHFM